MQKISWAASNFGGNKELLAGFKQADMSKAEFSEQLRHAFGVRLQSQELQAVSEVFDLDGDGKVRSGEGRSDDAARTTPPPF